MRFKPEEITSIIRQELESFDTDVDVAEVGTILEVGDGIARIYGLDRAGAAEMLEFENGVRGQVFNLEEGSIGAIVLGDHKELKEGMSVRRTGKLLAVPVGPGLVGRVVDPLGNPIDGKGPLDQETTRPIEMIAPGIADRQPVKEPLQTGIKAIDAMTPIGRGQRELIIGDRKTGKTAIAIDAIINQKQENVLCVYVAVGQKDSTVARVVEELRARGAMDYTVVVVASAAAPAPLQYIAPYAGCAIAEHMMYAHRRHTLCVYDDLTKQATAYRQLSLLLRRPPGREAYPGDVFYLHSRLLERAIKLSDDMGAGSLTALPIIETQEGEVSAYIPTNVISITDGQIYLVPDLFRANVRPAVDVGISVSRVGGNAQGKAMKHKRVAGGLRLNLAAFRELEAFAQLGTDLDPTTQAQLDRGRRMVEILKQPQFQPMHVVDQVTIIYAGANGFLDKVPLARVQEYETQLLAYVADHHSAFRSAFVKGKTLDDATEKELQRIVGQFTEAFLAGAPRTRADDDEETPPPAMAKPRAIFKRRKAVQNIAKITKTMQMIATAKFKRTFDRAVAARPYTDALSAMIAELTSAAGAFAHPLLERREPRRVAVLAIASNRGMCGGYNSNVGKRLDAFRASVAQRGLPLEVHASGKKLGSMLRFQKVPVATLHREFEDRPSFERVDAVARDFLDRYAAGTIDELHVVYTKFESASRQRAVAEKVLPLERPASAAATRDYLFSPDAPTILSDLLPRSVRLHVFQAFLDAAVSEQTARMVAMKAATDNARDMIKSLTMLYNRSRQTLITTELSEIMGGAAALE